MYKSKAEFKKAYSAYRKLLKTEVRKGQASFVVALESIETLRVVHIAKNDVTPVSIACWLAFRNLKANK